jgi:hypothetical protein
MKVQIIHLHPVSPLKQDSDGLPFQVFVLIGTQNGCRMKSPEACGDLKKHFSRVYVIMIAQDPEAIISPAKKLT